MEHNDDCCPTLPQKPPAQTAPLPIKDAHHRLSLAASAGSIISAFLATACCVGPLIFALLGLGGAGLLLKFEPYRPYFIALTVAFLGAGFYFTYRRPRAVTAATDGEACDCPAPRTNRAGRIMLWVAATLVTGFLAFPYLVPFFID